MPKNMKFASLLAVSLIAPTGLAAARPTEPPRPRPANLVRSVMDQIAQFDEVRDGWLGVSARDRAVHTDPGYGISEGAVIVAVTPGSPAAAAGLKAGDIVLKINDAVVRDAEDLCNRLATSAARPPTKLEIERDGQRLILTATIGGRV